MKRAFRISASVHLDEIVPPVGGGLYFVTAEPSGRILYVGRTKSFQRRGFADHHRRADWIGTCGADERPRICFVILALVLSPAQLNDIEASLIRAASPPCNIQHVVRKNLLQKAKLR